MTNSIFLLQSANDEEHFSDDSLEDIPPPPPPPEVAEEPVSKRGSIAWEVPLDQDPLPLDSPEALLTPGSTKVVGRRRRRQSTENSSKCLCTCLVPAMWKPEAHLFLTRGALPSAGSSSLQNLKDQDDWPDPPSREHEPLSPSVSCILGREGRDDEDLYDSAQLPTALLASDLSASGTYVIRKGRKKERKPIRNVDSLQYNKARLQLKYAESKRTNYTFDALDSPSREELPPADAEPASPASEYPLVRVVSLPSIPHVEEARPARPYAAGSIGVDQERIAQQEERLIQRLQGLAVTPEEDEPSSSLVLNDLEHQDDSLEPISSLAFDVRDNNGPLSLIEEQAENGHELDDPAGRHRPSLGGGGGRLSSRELDEIAEIQNRKQLPPPPREDRFSSPHADYYNLNKDRIAENCRMADDRDIVIATKELNRPRKSASSNDVFSDTKCYANNSHSLSSTREREERQPSRRSSTDRRRHHQNMAAEMSSMERWRTTQDMNHVQVVPIVERVPTHSRNGSAGHSSLERDAKRTHTVTVEVNQHDFGPLPPSPVDEFEEDEYSEIMHPSPGPGQPPRPRANSSSKAVKTGKVGKLDAGKEPFYQCREPLGSDPSGARYLHRPPEPPPHVRDAPRDPTHSLKTRSMDAGFTRGYRNASQSSALRREVSAATFLAFSLQYLEATITVFLTDVLCACSRRRRQSGARCPTTCLARRTSAGVPSRSAACRRRRSPACRRRARCPRRPSSRAAATSRARRTAARPTCRRPAAGPRPARRGRRRPPRGPATGRATGVMAPACSPAATALASAPASVRAWALALAPA